MITEKEEDLGISVSFVAYCFFFWNLIKKKEGTLPGLIAIFAAEAFLKQYQLSKQQTTNLE